MILNSSSQLNVESKLYKFSSSIKENFCSLLSTGFTQDFGENRRIIHDIDFNDRISMNLRPNKVIQEVKTSWIKNSILLNHMKSQKVPFKGTHLYL